MDTRTLAWAQADGNEEFLPGNFTSTAPVRGKRVSDGYDSPPLQHLHTYGSKPLPPAPARRSVASSMRSELSNAFRTPRLSIDYQDHRLEIDRDGQDSISVMLDASVANHEKHQRMARHTNHFEDSHLSPQSSPLYSNRFSQGSYQSSHSHGSYRSYQDHSRAHGHPLPQQADNFNRQSDHYQDPYVLPKLGTTFPCIPPDEILSPQPKSSISKILQIAGHGSKPITSPSIKSPTGHNSANKISQMTGLDTAVSTWHARGASYLDEISPVSPISSVSSIYSQDLEATISEPDVDMSYTRQWQCEDGIKEAKRPASQADSFRNSTWLPHSPNSVPMALNIRKSGHRQGNAQQSPVESYRSARRRSTRVHLNATSPRQRHDDDLEIDLYHATANKIARSTQSTQKPSHSKLKDIGKHSHSTTTSQQLPVDLLKFSTSSHQHKKDDHNRKHDSSKSSFRDRVYQSTVRNGPPAELRTSSQRLPALAATRIEAHRTQTATSNQSVFDPDTDDESSREPSTLAKMFKRNSGGIVEFTKTATPSQGYSRVTPVPYAARSVSASSSTYSLAVPPTVSSISTQDRVVVANRSRKADGPDTPMPPGMLQKTGEHFQGLMAQAKNMMSSKSDRKRESLKSKIRVIPEGEIIGGVWEEKQARW